jgi:hypothetical protein
MFGGPFAASRLRIHVRSFVFDENRTLLKSHPHFCAIGADPEQAHNVYLSQQSLDILIALKTCAGNSRYLLPSRYDADAPMSRATFNRVTTAVVARAKKEGLPLEPFTVHDLRRTGSTLLNEMGFNSDWIEKCLAHEDGRSSRGVYNKAEYEPQRRHMLQEWADMVDAWVNGQKRVPTLLPPSMPFVGVEGCREPDRHSHFYVED